MQHSIAHYIERCSASWYVVLLQTVCSWWYPLYCTTAAPKPAARRPPIVISSDAPFKSTPTGRRCPDLDPMHPSGSSSAPEDPTCSLGVWGHAAVCLPMGGNMLTWQGNACLPFLAVDLLPFACIYTLCPLLHGKIEKSFNDF